eukprot:2412636-Rhodomonas_salina.1
MAEKGESKGVDKVERRGRGRRREGEGIREEGRKGGRGEEGGREGDRMEMGICMPACRSATPSCSPPHMLHLRATQCLQKH